MINRIFLIGYRATGKTTVGTLLADRLGFDFIDTDHMVCESRKESIQSIVEKDGWEEFRRCEAISLRDAAQGDNRVVATGGGAVLHAEVWPDIIKNAFVVWLTADVHTIADRIQQAGRADRSRPSLTDMAPVLEIEKVLAGRLALYKKYSNVEIDTGSGDVDLIVGNILKAYANFIGQYDH